VLLGREEVPACRHKVVCFRVYRAPRHAPEGKARTMALLPGDDGGKPSRVRFDRCLGGVPCFQAASLTCPATPRLPVKRRWRGGRLARWRPNSVAGAPPTFRHQFPEGPYKARPYKALSARAQEDAPCLVQFGRHETLPLNSQVSIGLRECLQRP
jgi:hypothetical protein